MPKKNDQTITFDDVFTYENLLKAYNHCRKGKRFRKGTVTYHVNYQQNLHKLLKSLQNQTYKIRDLYTFIIYEPKKRFITANQFEDKIVQRVLCKYVLEKVIQPKLIYDNYASQPNKGTHLALKRLKHNMASYAKTNNWENSGHVAVGDISKFFYTIDKNICCQMINKLPIDDALKKLIYDQIFVYEAQFNEYSDDPNQGICIGFQTSQWLAVFYLNELDHFIKEELHIKWYGRYMDDFYLIHHDREYLKYCMIQIEWFVSEKLNLKMNPKSHIHEFRQGICFLGYHCTYNEMTHQIDTVIRNKAIRRLNKRTKKQSMLISKGVMTRDQALSSVECWNAYAKHGETKKSRNAFEKAIKTIDPYTFDRMMFYNWLNDPTRVNPEGFLILKPTSNKFDLTPGSEKITMAEVLQQNEYDSIKRHEDIIIKQNTAILNSISRGKKPKTISNQADIIKHQNHIDNIMDTIIDDPIFTYTHKTKKWKHSHPQQYLDDMFHYRDKDGFIHLAHKISKQ